MRSRCGSSFVLYRASHTGHPFKSYTSMAFMQRLAEAAELVERRLEAILAESGGCGGSQRLGDAMRHGVLGGGKRFRPFLVIESARLFGVAPERSVEAGAAVELIHCYSLVHDDLPAMDNDELRRGQPTVWRAFDDWTAILAGDGLQALAFTCTASEAAHAEPVVRAELTRLLAVASGPEGMVGGQALDLEAEKLGLASMPTREHIRRLQAMKTGALIRFSCEAGAVIGLADADDRAALRRFGEHLGFAFQIADDLLDVEGDAETMGKAVAKDSDAGKATLVSLMGVEAARKALTDTEAAAIETLEPFGAKADVLREAARFVVSRKS